MIWDVTGEPEEVDPRPSILGAGGPDAFGYSWTDSDEPGGPVYDWVDISSVGARVPWAYSDDGNSGPFPIGFDFPFYENSFNEVRVVTNGWLSFTSTRTTYSNQPLPNSGSAVPENLLAVFWDDLVHRSGTGSEPEPSNVYYYNDGSRFIVQYDRMYRIANYTDDINFQVILYPNGKIVYQYETMVVSTINSHTIGIQNATKDDGLTVVYNDGSYIHDNMAIEFSTGPDWLTLDPLAGIVPAGECATLTVGLDSAELAEGDYDGLISILNNDPFNSLIEVPILLHVAEVELDYIRVDPDTLNLSSVGRTIKAVLQLPEPYDPHDIVIESVSIYGQIFALSHPYDYVDENFDGVEELMVKFDRQAFEAVVPEGDDIPITITGEVRDTVWFTGTDTIRAIRPHVTQPNGGEYLLAGQNVSITWDPPTDGPTPQSYSVWLNRDGSDELEELAVGVTGTQVAWTVTGAETTLARIMVMAHDGRGVMGSDISDADFTIAEQLYPPHPAYGLALQKSVADLALSWQRPGIDLLHGPVNHYRIMRATSPQGPFTEIDSAVPEMFTDSSATGQIYFYKIVATNQAGDAVP